MFKSLIRSILEYTNDVWSRSQGKDINALEQINKIQSTIFCLPLVYKAETTVFTKCIIVMRKLPYEERLNN